MRWLFYVLVAGYLEPCLCNDCLAWNLRINPSSTTCATRLSSSNITLTEGATAVGPKGASYVEGGNKGEWNVNSSGMKSGEAAHEGGHLMGAPDHYTEGTDAAGNRTSSAENGFQGNLMGELPGKPDDRNMQEIYDDKKNKHQ
jgi:hypothetical protein